MGKHLRPSDDLVTRLRRAQSEIRELQRELKRTKETLKTLIAWMAQSANSPISRSEAIQLLRKADGDDV